MPDPWGTRSKRRRGAQDAVGEPVEVVEGVTGLVPVQGGHSERGGDRGGGGCGAGNPAGGGAAGASSDDRSRRGGRGRCGGGGDGGVHRVSGGGGVVDTGDVIRRAVGAVVAFGRGVIIGRFVVFGGGVEDVEPADEFGDLSGSGFRGEEAFAFDTSQGLGGFDEGTQLFDRAGGRVGRDATGGFSEDRTCFGDLGVGVIGRRRGDHAGGFQVHSRFLLVRGVGGVASDRP